MFLCKTYTLMIRIRIYKAIGETLDDKEQESVLRKTIYGLFLESAPLPVKQALRYSYEFYK